MRDGQERQATYFPWIEKLGFSDDGLYLNRWIADTLKGMKHDGRVGPTARVDKLEIDDWIWGGKYRIEFRLICTNEQGEHWQWEKRARTVDNPGALVADGTLTVDSFNFLLREFASIVPMDIDVAWVEWTQEDMEKQFSGVLPFRRRAGDPSTGKPSALPTPGR